MVPKSSCIDISYLLCDTIPLSERMFQNPTKALESINLSISLPGHQLNLVKNKPKPEEPYIFKKEAPQKFWEILQAQIRLPTNQTLRKKFTTKIFDLQHKHNCIRPLSDFHNHADQTLCKCKHCKKPMGWYHTCDQTILD